MVEAKVKNLLGLAMRAGKVVSGEENCNISIKKDSHLIIVARDASANTTKKFINRCKFFNVPLRLAATKRELGMAIGRGDRAVVSIADKGFAKELIRYIDCN